MSFLSYSCFLCEKLETKMGVRPNNGACRSFGSGNGHFKQAYSTILNTKQVAFIGALKLPSRPYSAQISSIRISLSPFEPDRTLERQSKAVSSLTDRHENRTGMYNIYSLYMLYFVQVKLYNFWPKMSFEVVVGAFLSVFTCYFLAVEVEWPVDSNIRLIFESIVSTFDCIACLAHSFHEDL